MRLNSAQQASRVLGVGVPAWTLSPLPQHPALLEEAAPPAVGKETSHWLWPYGGAQGRTGRQVPALTRTDWCR